MGARRITPEAVWYGSTPLARALSLLLAPLGWLYCTVASLRALAYRHGWLRAEGAGVPVIVVGNLTVGGTGKTPLVLWLVGHLRRRGLRPGVASRGYGGTAGEEGPVLVPAAGKATRSSGPFGGADPARFGDEPALLAARCGCPVMVGRDRVAAARALVERHGCDVVVTDDGLQHYRLRRDLEILVIDGARGYGNGRCLPAGPLREPRGRERRAALSLVNGPTQGMAGGGAMGMALVPGDAVNLYDTGLRRPLAAFRGRRLIALAAIGNPGRFFAMLRGLGLRIDPRPFPDHHGFTAEDFAGLPAGQVLMTEKDAIKCRRWATSSHWYVPVEARPDDGFVAALDRLLDARLGAGGEAGGPPAER